MKILIKNGNVITMDDKNEKIIQADVLIEDDKIAYIGKYSGEYDKVIDATSKIVMPGLINCHTHIGMSLFRATNDDYTLNKWLNDYIWPIEDKMTDEDMYWTTMLSLIEMVKTGTTCFNDMYFGFKGSFKAFDKIGIRGVYARCLAGEGASWDEHVKEFEESLTYKNELITPSIAIHSLYTTDEEGIKDGEALASKYNLPIHIHVSENKEEVSTVTKKYNTLPFNVLERNNIFNHKVIVAHGTFISDEEIEIIKDKDVSICTNPVSNLNLGCGIADITKYIKLGINVCMGTDGVGSGNNLNMFYHMSILDNLQKGIYKDPTVMSSYDVLKTATINGAKALNLNIGSIEVGKKADIIIVDMDKLDAKLNPIVSLVHNSFDNVNTTIINGNILMEDKKLLIDVDEENIKNKVIDIIERLK